MARPASGTVFHEGGRWKARLTMPDGRRKVFPLPAWYTEEQARAKAAEMARAIKLRGVDAIETIDLPADETFADYADRWCAVREALGLTSVAWDRSRLRIHVLPILGPLSVRMFSTVDVERVRDALDTKIRAGSYVDAKGRREAFGWKSASNVWTLLTSMCRDMRTSKDRSLRVRDTNPAVDVAPPDRGKRKAKVYLFPSEFVAVINGDAPLAWRRAFAVATYLYLRRGELDALEWTDVDLEHRRVHVTKARQADGTIGAPKNGTSRVVPVEETLLPLLVAMHQESGGVGVVAPIPGADHAARYVREALGRADVTRADLFTSDATRKQLGFHDATRATGITWAAVRGDEPLRIKQRAGHASFSTTEGYIREADNMREGFGVPFPALPAELLGASAPTVIAEPAAEEARRRPTRGFGRDIGRQPPRRSRRLEKTSAEVVEARGVEPLSESVPLGLLRA